ncbi:MAG TPA: hypothetical protein VJT67_11385 [Longimicrobiaceae bacterium]|nr:hypothetical protein [Longimicrobiaceae bacterium]
MTPNQSAIHGRAKRASQGISVVESQPASCISCACSPTMTSRTPPRSADVMKRIAAPMVGGMVSSTLLTLIVIPAIYSLWKEREVQRAAEA